MAEEHLVDKLVMTDFTEETRDGTGVFDSFMRATKAHIAEEYNKNRITGSDYATVYLSALNATADRALEFLMRKDEQWLRNRALEVELEKAELEKLKLIAEEKLINAQITKVEAEERKIDKEIEYLDKQLLMLVDEHLKLQHEVKVMEWQVKKTEQEVELIKQQILKLQEENKLLDAQEAKIRKEITVMTEQILQIKADTALTKERTLLTTEQIQTEIAQELVLDATVCKLKAEYELILKQKEKIGSEMDLLAQRTNTEKAQTIGGAIGAGSVLASQVKLYGRQAEGYLRDAEQKAAKMMIDTWNVRRTTDETGTAGNTVNKLNDDYVGKAVTKLINGLDQA